VLGGGYAACFFSGVLMMAFMGALEVCVTCSLLACPAVRKAGWSKRSEGEAGRVWEQMVLLEVG
jgi:hypothetical protein